MKRIKAKSVVAVVFVAMVLFSAQVYAGGAGKTPRGKPFIELAGQILEVEGEVSTIQDQVDSIVAKVDTIEEKVDANVETIASLEEQNAVLQGQINASVSSIQAEIADLEAANADLQAQIDVSGGDIDGLQAELNTNDGLISSLSQSISDLSVDLQDQINNNKALITALETEIQAINVILAEKQRIEIGSCLEGQSIRVINADGSVECEIDDVAGGSTIDRVTVSRYRGTPASTYLEMEAFCPAGYIVSGGGALAYPNGGILGSIPTADGWKAYIENKADTGSHSFVYANCIKMVVP